MKRYYLSRLYRDIRHIFQIRYQVAHFIEEVISRKTKHPSNIVLEMYEENVLLHANAPFSFSM